jgi:hydroxymethylglutaryl-CoA reductase
VLDGNIENFIGVAQVPVGVAGPLLVDGEHARGTFYVPLATTEGALVASYNCGMKLLYAAGRVRTTVVAEAMQRAPAFGFDSAREARAFGDWLTVSFNLGGLLAGAGGNANHPANAVAALFAATGQDIANVAESSAALVHTELLADGSYYYSITIPALIVATYGGGTGLPTQRERLELLGCYGPDRVRPRTARPEPSLGGQPCHRRWTG